MPPVIQGKYRLMSFTIRSTWSSFEFANRPDKDTFLAFAQVCQVHDGTRVNFHGQNKYSHPPTLESVKKYFDFFLEKTDFEDPMDRFRELHKKLETKLSTFTKPGVECIRGLILYFCYTSGLLKTYDELYEAAKYLNDHSNWKIQYSEYPIEEESKVLARLQNEDEMICCIMQYTYQTYHISIKASGLMPQFEEFVRTICKVDKDYHHGPISTHVPSYRTLRKCFEDFYPIFFTRPKKDQFLQAYKMIEKKNKKGCKTAVHGLLMFFGYQNALLQSYDDVFEIARVLTKYKRPNKVSDDAYLKFIATQVNRLKERSLSPKRETKDAPADNFHAYMNAVTNQLYGPKELSVSPKPEIKQTTENADDSVSSGSIKTEKAENFYPSVTIKAEIVEIENDPEFAEFLSNQAMWNPLEGAVDEPLELVDLGAVKTEDGEEDVSKCFDLMG